jgi:recombination protein RecA
MYGDPTTTPGGKAIPFHSSVRIKLGAGQRIENKEKEVIGIHVSAKTIKNKVSAPFRTCNFEIHFGVGIIEHEQLFDVLRKHGPETIAGKTIEVSGSGSWKKLSVTDEVTGEVLTEKKFFKSDFNEILDDEKYKTCLEDLIEAALVKKSASKESIDIDIESYEEVRAISDDLEEVLSDLTEG